MEKIYHIYAKDNCLFHSVKEDEFSTVWNTLHQMVGIMKTSYTESDLSYAEVTLDKEVIHNSSH